MASDGDSRSSLRMTMKAVIDISKRPSETSQRKRFTSFVIKGTKKFSGIDPHNEEETVWGGGDEVSSMVKQPDIEDESKNLARAYELNPIDEEPVQEDTKLFSRMIPVSASFGSGPISFKVTQNMQADSGLQSPLSRISADQSLSANLFSGNNSLARGILSSEARDSAVAASFGGSNHKSGNRYPTIVPGTFQ